jgi:peroxiredoxin
MSYLPAFFAALGVLCLVNLVLTVALARQVRRHGAQLASGPQARGPATLMPPGTKVPEFTAVTVSGEHRSLQGLGGSRSLVGLFSPGCPPCHAQKPAFAEFARTIPGGPAQVLAVITGEDEEAAKFAAELDGVASVVIESVGGTVAAAFSTPGRPSFFLIGADGRIEASATAVRMLDRVSA